MNAIHPVRGRWHQRGPRKDMNRDEAGFSAVLEERKAKGEIVRWDFGVERLRLADATWYLPDFRVLMPDGEIHFFEVKGFVESTGRVKIKVAAELHPYRFFQVSRRRKKDGGGWSVDEINAEAAC
jgi:hypothetical protein